MSVASYDPYPPAPPTSPPATAPMPMPGWMRPPLLLPAVLVDRLGIEPVGLLTWLHAHAEPDPARSGGLLVATSVKVAQKQLGMGAARWAKLLTPLVTAGLVTQREPTRAGRGQPTAPGGLLVNPVAFDGSLLWGHQFGAPHLRGHQFGAPYSGAAPPPNCEDTPPLGGAGSVRPNPYVVDETPSSTAVDPVRGTGTVPPNQLRYGSWMDLPDGCGDVLRELGWKTKPPHVPVEHAEVFVAVARSYVQAGLGAGALHALLKQGWGEVALAAAALPAPAAEPVALMDLADYQTRFSNDPEWAEQVLAVARARRDAAGLTGKIPMLLLRQVALEVS